MDRSDKFYTIEEATDLLGVSEQEIMNMISMKKLPAVKIEKSIKIREEDMERFLDSLGKKDMESNNVIENETEPAAETEEVYEEEIENGYEVKEEPESGKIQSENSYRELLRKKQELEEDINYLQFKYDEFKKRIKSIISEEFKLFLKEIDEGNLPEGDEVLGNNFDNDLDMYKDIDRKEENDYHNHEEDLFAEDNGKEEKKLIPEKDDKIELGENGTDN